MQIIKGWDAIKSQLLRHQIITIGSFDGIHKGHRKILERMQAIARERKLPTVLLTFEAHPRAYLHKEEAQGFLLHTLTEKLNHLAPYQIDTVAFLPFDERLVNCSAEAYLEDILVPYFLPSVIVIGSDHRFGKDRKGDVNLLRNKAAAFGYEVSVVGDALYEGEKISSTRIRNCITRYEMEKAQVQLGYPYTFSGTVVRGNQLGRTIGFPTANIENSNPLKLQPANGVYAATVQIEGYRQEFYGMMNRGFRPTVNQSLRPIVEVNIFDFDDMIYDKKISVLIHTFIRMEEKFVNKDSLITQLKKDKENIAQYFKQKKDHIL